MPAPKRKPTKKPAPAPVEHPAPAEEQAPVQSPALTVADLDALIRSEPIATELPSEAQVNAMIDGMFPAPKLNTWEYRASGSPVPQPTEEATSLAQMVRAHDGTRDVHFSPEQGVTLMFGYKALVRVMPGHRHVHIATVDELTAMSVQQIYDAVKQAGNGK